MYDSPTQRDERISKLERECARLSGELVECARLLAQGSTLIRQLTEKQRSDDELARKALSMLTDGHGILNDCLAYVDEKHPAIYADLKQFIASKAASDSGGPCDCPTCRAEREGKSGLAGFLSSLFGNLFGGKGSVTVEAIPGDLIDEFKRRIAADGPRKAYEWLGAEQLKRGAEGR